MSTRFYVDMDAFCKYMRKLSDIKLPLSASSTHLEWDSLPSTRLEEGSLHSLLLTSLKKKKIFPHFKSPSGRNLTLGKDSFLTSLKEDSLPVITLGKCFLRLTLLAEHFLPSSRLGECSPHLFWVGEDSLLPTRLGNDTMSSTSLREDFLPSTILGENSLPLTHLGEDSVFSTRLGEDSPLSSYCFGKRVLLSTA